MEILYPIRNGSTVAMYKKWCLLGIVGNINFDLVYRYNRANAPFSCSNTHGMSIWCVLPRRLYVYNFFVCKEIYDYVPWENWASFCRYTRSTKLCARIGHSPNLLREWLHCPKKTFCPNFWTQAAWVIPFALALHGAAWRANFFWRFWTFFWIV